MDKHLHTSVRKHTIIKTPIHLHTQARTHLITCLYMHPAVCSHNHLITQSLTHIVICTHTHANIYTYTHVNICTYTHANICTLAHAIICMLAHAFISVYRCLITQSLTHLFRIYKHFVRQPHGTIEKYFWNISNLPGISDNWTNTAHFWGLSFWYINI